MASPTDPSEAGDDHAAAATATLRWRDTSAASMTSRLLREGVDMKEYMQLISAVQL